MNREQLTSRWLLYIFIGIIAVLLSAQDLTARSRSHDGYYIGLLIGPTLGRFIDSPSQESGEEEREYSGNGGFLTVKGGYAFWRNTILHLGLASNSDGDVETVKEGGQELTGINASYGLAAISGGVTRYFGKNHYFSADGRYIFYSATEEGQVTTQFNGYGVALALGTEWWISNEWGIGLAVAFYQDFLEGERREIADNAIAYTGEGEHRSIALLFSATYN